MLCDNMKKVDTLKENFINNIHYLMQFTITIMLMKIILLIYLCARIK